MGLASTPYRPYGEFAMRYAARLNREVRLRLHGQREDLFFTLERLDDELQALARQRQAILTELGELRDRLWPRVDWCHGRRPPTRRPAAASPAERRDDDARRPRLALRLPCLVPAVWPAPARPAPRSHPPARLRHREQAPGESPRRCHGLRASQGTVDPPRAGHLRAATRLQAAPRPPRQWPGGRPRCTELDALRVRGPTG